MFSIILENSLIFQNLSLRWKYWKYQQTNSERLQGVIRNPFAFYFPIQRGFSGSIQTPPLQNPSFERGCVTNLCPIRKWIV